MLIQDKEKTCFLEKLNRQENRRCMTVKVNIFCVSS
jgi:hypothetical protein